MLRILVCTFAVLLLGSSAAAQFTDGHIYITDYGSDQVYDVDPTDWSWSVFADLNDGISGPSALGFTSAGRMLVSNHSSSTVIEFDDAGNGAVVLDSSDGLSGPWGENGIAIDVLDRVYVANYGASQILRFDPDYTNGVVFADSSDGIRQPDGLGFVSNGDMLVANRASGGQVLHLDPAGTTTVWNTIFGEDCFSLVVRDNADVYVACLSGNVYRYLGGDPANRVLFGTWGSSNPGLCFSPDYSVLYHTNFGDGMLRAIDPDTASETVVVNAGWGSIGIAVSGSQHPPGSFSQIGTGLAGTGGVTPTLEGVGIPRTGASVVLETRDFVGGATTFFLLSSARDDLDAFGATIYPSFLAPFVLRKAQLPGAPGVPGEGDEDHPYTLPSDPSMIGTNWYFQQFAIDPGAVQGVCLTAGLRMYVGE